jgi:DNA-binding NtrC family response regulator
LKKSAQPRGSAEAESEEDALKGDAMTRSASSPTETRTESILVVDDDPGILAGAEDMLRSMGYTVISTVDPRVALRFARLSGSIHLLLTDVVMPLMGGGQLAQEFRKVRPEAKVLFMSAYNVESVKAYRVELAPGEPFLKKPFTMDELQKTVQAALVYRPPSTRPRTPSRG